MKWMKKLWNALTTITPIFNLPKFKLDHSSKYYFIITCTDDCYLLYGNFNNNLSGVRIYLPEYDLWTYCDQSCLLYFPPYNITPNDIKEIILYD